MLIIPLMLLLEAKDKYRYTEYFVRTNSNATEIIWRLVEWSIP